MFSSLYSPSPALRNSDNEDSIFPLSFLKEEKTVKLNSSSCYCDLFGWQFSFFFFLLSAALKKPWVGKCLSGGEYGPLQLVATEVNGQSGELLLPAL